MKFIILGSGGCVTLPRPLCDCEICKQARQKEEPYLRHGCSIFLEEVNLLIDTPEDIISAINNAELKNIDNIMFSHVDPDHTMGIRVIEQLRLCWAEQSIGIKCNNPINVMALENVLEDIRSIGFKGYSMLDYYENVHNLMISKAIENTVIEGIKISLIPIGASTVFVFEENNKKLIYAPCDCKPFPQNDIFNNADILIVGNTMPSRIFKGGIEIKEDNPLSDELYYKDEMTSIAKGYNIKEIIFTHLEEDYGLSYDDYCDMETDDIKYAYDGMIIEL